MVLLNVHTSSTNVRFCSVAKLKLSNSNKVDLNK